MLDCKELLEDAAKVDDNFNDEINKMMEFSTIVTLTSILPLV